MQEQDTETTDSDKQIKVEVVKTADGEQLKSLYKEAGWWSENEDTVDPDLIHKIIQGSFCFAVASINGRIIGMGRAISDGASDAYIQDVVVSAEFRGRGIAVLIMDALIQFLKDKKIGWIALISEPKAVSFYQRYGLSQMTDYVPFALK
jgi:spermidine synthase